MVILIISRKSSVKKGKGCFTRKKVKERERFYWVEEVWLLEGMGRGYCVGVVRS